MIQELFFFGNSVKINEKLWNRVLECWPGLSDEKRIGVLSVLIKKLWKKQIANFFWTTRYVMVPQAIDPYGAAAQKRSEPYHTHSVLFLGWI